jgi:hypothetical protein
MKLNESQLETFLHNYAEMIVDGMDMNTLISYAVDSIEQNLKGYDLEDLKEEILDHYDQEVLDSLLPVKESISELEVNTPQMGMGVGK